MNAVNRFPQGGLRTVLHFRWRRRAYLVLGGLGVALVGVVLRRRQPVFAEFVDIGTAALLIALGVAFFHTFRRREGDRRENDRRHDERRDEEEPNHPGS